MGVLSYLKSKPKACAVAHGVSIDYLIDFYERLFKGYEAVGIQLFVCIKDSPIYGYNKRYSLPLKAGETIQFKFEVENDEWYGYVANRAQGTFDPKLVRPKLREEWTIQDVAEFVVKTKTLSFPTMSYVDLLSDQLVGKPYKGTFMYVDAQKTEFRSFVQSMGLFFDKTTDPEERFIWLDAFSAAQHKSSRNENFEVDVAKIASKFSQRMYYFGNSSPQLQDSVQKGSRPIIMNDVMIGGQFSTVYIEYSLAEGLATILAHLKYRKSILAVHKSLFGDASVGVNSKLKAKGNTGKTGFKNSKKNSLGFRMPFMSSMKDDFKKEKKGKKGLMNEIIDMPKEEILSNLGIMGILSTFLSERDHPELAKADYMSALINRNCSL